MPVPLRDHQREGRGGETPPQRAARGVPGGEGRAGGYRCVVGDRGPRAVDRDHDGVAHQLTGQEQQRGREQGGPSPGGTPGQHPDKQQQREQHRFGTQRGDRSGDPQAGGGAVRDRIVQQSMVDAQRPPPVRQHDTEEDGEADGQQAGRGHRPTDGPLTLAACPHTTAAGRRRSRCTAPPTAHTATVANTMSRRAAGPSSTSTRLIAATATTAGSRP